jgi:hypothetical protein
VLTLRESIIKWAQKKAEAQARARSVRAYNAGSCVRKLWYGEHGFVPQGHDWKAVMRMDLGDILEQRLATISEYANQDVVDAIVFKRATSSDDTFLDGVGQIRVDGFVSGEPYGFTGTIWVDWKTMSSYPFERADAGDVGYQYQAQGECYCRGYEMPGGVFLCYHKDTSEMCEVRYHQDDAIWAKVLTTTKVARESESSPQRPDMPCSCEKGMTRHAKPRPHEMCGGTGFLLKDGELPKGVPFIPNFPCGMCEYRLDCWGSLEEVETKDWKGEAKSRLRPCLEGRISPKF